LHYLGKYETPTSVDDCAIKTTIVFTEYGFASVMPKARVSRRTAVNSERSFTLAELNQFAEFEGWQGDALDNLSETLDAMIDGSLSMANR
ncbi:MAG TPA: hypothetical protein VG713_04170, partial [Pirellulales bacterium]|nr:hypothetical protein [Pirellulales bacterium]